jgi:hypothetical protein
VSSEIKGKYQGLLSRLNDKAANANLNGTRTTCGTIATFETIATCASPVEKPAAV